MEVCIFFVWSHCHRPHPLLISPRSCFLCRTATLPLSTRCRWTSVPISSSSLTIFYPRSPVLPHLLAYLNPVPSSPKPLLTQAFVTSSLSVHLCMLSLSVASSSRCLLSCLIIQLSKPFPSYWKQVHCSGLSCVSVFGSSLPVTASSSSNRPVEEKPGAAICVRCKSHNKTMW